VKLFAAVRRLLSSTKTYTENVVAVASTGEMVITNSVDAHTFISFRKQAISLSRANEMRFL